MTSKWMNGKLLLAVACLLLLADVGIAQRTISPDNRHEVIFILERHRQSPVLQQGRRNHSENLIRSLWEGRSSVFWGAHVRNDPAYRAVFGISEEQLQQIEELGDKETPEIQKLNEEWDMMVIPGDSHLLTADVEMVNQISDIHRRSLLLEKNVWSDAIDSVLTQEQKQKIFEAQLVAMEELPIISPKMFEALNITDAQKQQMEIIKKELEPEFENLLEAFVSNAEIVWNKETAEIVKQLKLGYHGESEELTKTIRKKLMAEDPEYKRVKDAIQSTGQAFATQFREKLFDVLTDAQWIRLQKLLDNPPEHAKAYIKQVKIRLGRNEEGKNQGWIPGPGAWQPGSSAIPEQYRQERNSRFPRGGN
jgi:hypothetical protein